MEKHLHTQQNQQIPHNIAHPQDYVNQHVQALPYADSLGRTTYQTMIIGRGLTKLEYYALEICKAMIAAGSDAEMATADAPGHASDLIESIHTIEQAE